MDQYGMLANIRAHSLMVGRVAGLLAKALNAAGQGLSLELAVSGGLLHDIAKTRCLGQRELRHDVLGGEICRVHGFSVEIAAIVAEHVMLKGGLAEAGFAERELVYYADKRVLHDRVVGLAERQEYVLARYSHGDAALHARIRQNFLQAREVEERIFAWLDFAPEEVAGRLAEGGFVIPELSHV